MPKLGERVAIVTRERKRERERGFADQTKLLQIFQIRSPVLKSKFSPGTLVRKTYETLALSCPHEGENDSDCNAK